MIIILVVGAIGAITWYLFVKPLSYWNNLGVKQTNPWPLFGDLLGFALRTKSFPQYIEDVYKLYPNSRYTGFYQFTTPTLALRDPELIKQITVKYFDHFTDHRSFVDSEADPLFGGNLFSLKGQKWREMRATLSGSFTSSKMKLMFQLMDDAAVNFVKYFLNKEEDIIEAEMKDIYTRYTNDVIATTAFGITVDSLAEPNNTFYRMGKKATTFDIVKNIKFCGYLIVPKLFKLLKIPFLDTDVGTFFTKVISESIQVREDGGIVRQDMINLLMNVRKGATEEEENEAIETGYATVKESNHIGKFKQIKKISNEEITAQALIFFFAGFDSISTVMCFGSHELALNKNVQDKLRKEIKQTYTETNGKLTYESLLKMKYMDMVVSEILRMWPAAPGMDRVVTKPYTIESVNPEETPVSLKVGDIVWLPIHGLHRDPEYFPNPDKFDPDRFSEENRDSIKPYTYIPFGSGPRNCIGSRFALLETKALLFHLLLNFEITPTKKTRIPLVLSRGTFNTTAKGGFWYGLKRIKT